MDSVVFGFFLEYTILLHSKNGGGDIATKYMYVGDWCPLPEYGFGVRQ